MDPEALRYILGNDSARNQRLPPPLRLTPLPQVFVPIPKDEKLQSNSYFPNSKMKQASSQSPEEGKI